MESIMKGIVRVLLSAMLVFVSMSSLAVVNGFDCWKSDEDLASYVILEIREKFNGTCLCPHDLDAKGNYCGNKSAFRRPSSGITVICKPEDVLHALVVKYRDIHCPPSNSILADQEEIQN